MLKSMTGYGYAQIQDDMCSQQWEIKSVNGKQLSLRWRLPSFLRSYEPVWDKEVRRLAERGRVDINLQVSIFQPELTPVHVNQGLALAMMHQLQALASAQGHSWQPDYARLLNVPSLWEEGVFSDHKEQGERFGQGLSLALQEWEGFRQREGESLVQDVLGRVQSMGQWVRILSQETQDLASQRLQVLRERVASLLGQEGSDLDEQRMLQELALLADKLDVSEEITRLETHVRTLESFLREGSAGGRKLDFLLQECFREINTLGNKAQNSQVSQLVVDFKAELEKCREQVQNLE